PMNQATPWPLSVGRSTLGKSVRPSPKKLTQNSHRLNRRPCAFCHHIVTEGVLYVLMPSGIKKSFPTPDSWMTWTNARQHAQTRDILYFSSQNTCTLLVKQLYCCYSNNVLHVTELRSGNG